MRELARAVLAVSLAAAVPVHPVVARGEDDVARALAALDGEDARAAEEGLAELARIGEPAAQRALADLAASANAAVSARDSTVSLAGRRRRAELVRRSGGRASIDAALASLADPDPWVRTSLIDFVARPDLGDAEVAERARGLEDRALLDADAEVRARALDALAALDETAATEALDRLVDRLPWPERTRAAASLAGLPRARALVIRRVAAGFASDDPAARARTPDDVLAAELPAYGRALAEVPSGGETAKDRAPFVLGTRHPDRRVRAAAALGLDRLILRLRQLGEHERAARCLARMEEQGLEVRAVAFQRGLLALHEAHDPELARSAAEVVAARRGIEDEDLDWRSRGLALEALALVAAGSPEEAERPLAEAARLLDALLASRADLRAEASADEHLRWLNERAEVELLAALASLAAEASAGERPPAEVLESLRRAHAFDLEAQLFAMRHEDLSPQSSWDDVLESDLGPTAFLLDDRGFPAWPAERALALFERFGRALASVSPREMPGFEPFPGVPEEAGDPLLDPERKALLDRIHEARIDGLEAELGRLYAEDLDLAQRDPMRLAELWRRSVEIQAELKQLDEPDGDRLEHRVPCSAALSLARALRTEGRTRESRERAVRMRADLEAQDLLQRFYWGIERAAEIEMAIGSSYTDEGEPARAEEELEKAVARLEEFERLMVERGLGPVGLRGIRSLRCSALVSLAVNANVKRGDPERARAYFERAYELRQDDFMRVLLACYRARSGDAGEARALLREIHPSPDLYYNLACTYALLGERERALEFLSREFEVNHPSPGSLAKQQDWARSDPDLAALRDLPRFRELVGG